MNEKETYKFVKKAFKDGAVETSGVEISKILPPISRFSKTGDRTIKKNNVIAKIVEFFKRFFTISDNFEEWW